LLNSPLQHDYTSEDRHLADFFLKIGSRVVMLKSGLWTSHGARIFEPVLIKGPLKPSADDINQLWDGGALFLRYPAPPDQDRHAELYPLGGRQEL
jgi:hypothetical protein